MEDKLDIAIPGLHKGKYVRVHYESLTAHPVKEMERIYTQLELDGFAAALPHIESYLASRAHYNKNRFELSHGKAKNIFLAWEHIFKKYGYPAPTCQG